MASRALWVSITLGIVLATLPVTVRAAVTERTDPQAEIELGRRAAREIERQLPLSSDRASQERVHRVGHAVLDQVEPRIYPYEFKVLAVPEVNAFALPGGFIYINEGLLARIPDDNALAFVLAHEATHSAHRHWAARVKKMEGIRLLATIAAVAVGGRSASASDLSGLAAALAVALIHASYSRQDENDADATAMEYLSKAGYDLEGGPAAMRMLQKVEGGGSVPRYLRDHPPAADRLARVSQLAKTLARRRRPAALSSDGQAAVPDLQAATVVGDLSGIAIGPNAWFPLAVGNDWTYEVKGARGKSAYTLRIVGVIAADEQTVYAAEIVLDTRTTIACQLLTTPGQVWRRSRSSANDPWRLETMTDVGGDSPQVRDGCEYRLLGVEEISLPCGNFSGARKIQRQAGKPTATSLLWFVEGIGLVKRQGVGNGVTETLVGYHIARPAAPAVPVSGSAPSPSAAPSPTQSR